MRKFVTGAVIAAVALAAPASAQIAVIDSANLAKAVDTARNTLETINQLEQQVAEARRLYDSVNGITDIQDVARVLDNRQLRGALPDGVTDASAYISDDLRDLGALSTRAEQIYNASDFRTGIGSTDQALEILGRRASRDLALAENDLNNSQARAEGVQALSDRLATATTQREIDEINARSQIETMGVLNDMARRQAAEDMQQAEAQRRAVERSAASRRAMTEGVAAQNRRINEATSTAISNTELDLTWGDGS